MPVFQNFCQLPCCQLGQRLHDSQTLPKSPSFLLKGAAAWLEDLYMPLCQDLLGVLCMFHQQERSGCGQKQLDPWALLLGDCKKNCKDTQSSLGDKKPAVFCDEFSKAKGQFNQQNIKWGSRRSRVGEGHSMDMNLKQNEGLWSRVNWTPSGKTY